jgi:hypothetical protein
MRFNGREPLPATMCHCFDDPSELSDEERAELLETHSEAELRAEHDAEELAALGLEA